MNDTKKKSTSEVITNILLSLPIHYFANFIILPPYAEAMYNSLGDMGAQAIIYAQLAFWFTIVSFVRQYLLRRLYNKFGPNETGFTLIKRGINRLRGIPNPNIL